MRRLLPEFQDTYYLPAAAEDNKSSVPLNQPARPEYPPALAYMRVLENMLHPSAMNQKAAIFELLDANCWLPANTVIDTTTWRDLHLVRIAVGPGTLRGRAPFAQCNTDRKDDVYTGSS